MDGDALGLHFEALGLIGSLLGRLWVACGLQRARQGAQMSYLSLLCRREHQLEGPGGEVGAQVPTRNPLLDAAVAPIEE